jgi:hypothetical protein
MIMGYTPFAPANPEDMTSLFTNIAQVKKKGFLLPLEFDFKFSDSPARNLVTALLRADPGERLGYQGDGTISIVRHATFQGLNVEVGDV